MIGARVSLVAISILAVVMRGISITACRLPEVALRGTSCQLETLVLPCVRKRRYSSVFASPISSKPKAKASCWPGEDAIMCSAFCAVFCSTGTILFAIPSACALLAAGTFRVLRIIDAPCPIASEGNGPEPPCLRVRLAACSRIQRIWWRFWARRDERSATVTIAYGNEVLDAKDSVTTADCVCVCYSCLRRSLSCIV